MGKVKLKNVIRFDLTEEQKEILLDAKDILNDMNEAVCCSDYDSAITTPIRIDVVMAHDALNILLKEHCGIR